MRVLSRWLERKGNRTSTNTLTTGGSGSGVVTRLGYLWSKQVEEKPVRNVKRSRTAPRRDEGCVLPARRSTLSNVRPRSKP